MVDVQEVKLFSCGKCGSVYSEESVASNCCSFPEIFEGPYHTIHVYEKGAIRIQDNISNTVGVAVFELGPSMEQFIKATKRAEELRDK